MSKFVWQLMAADMIESCIKRTLQAFEKLLQKGGKSTDYMVPIGISAMINVVIDAKNQVNLFLALFVLFCCH